jgi:predicted alpha/beta hydrolase family esterase
MSWTRPRRPDAAVIVGAHNDAYVSPKSVLELAAHWPGSQVRTDSALPLFGATSYAVKGYLAFV